MSHIWLALHLRCVVAAFVGLVFGQTSLLGIWGGLGTCSWRTRLIGVVTGVICLVLVGNRHSRDELLDVHSCRRGNVVRAHAIADRPLLFGSSFTWTLPLSQREVAFSSRSVT